MSKKIIVDRCYNCPLLVQIFSDRALCANLNTYGRSIEDLSTIPSWCVLEDN